MDILIVDDLEHNLMVLETFLTGQNYNILTAVSGKEAIDIVEKEHVDLILLDIMMPDINGFEVCKILKDKPETKEVPIIFLTAVTDPDYLLKGFKVGAVDYITKPFNYEELLIRVSTHLDLKKSKDLIKTQNTKLSKEVSRRERQAKEQYILNKKLYAKSIEIEKKKEEIESAHKDITDSINYAKYIQDALLPTKEYLDDMFENFIFFKPKGIVSGDFYYAKTTGKNKIFAVADCTGHGVPGGFLTMLGINFLNSITKNEKTATASESLEILRSSIKDIFTVSGNKDGMDIAYCIFDTENKTLQYSGAYNPMYLIRNGELVEYKAIRNPIGIHFREKNFVTHTIEIQKGDVIFLSSDGFADQISSEPRKKFSYRKLKDLLVEIHKLPVSEQRQVLENTFDNWKEGIDQVDDVLIMGIRFS